MFSRKLIGKKVRTHDGIEIGTITDVRRDELGYDIAIIETRFKELKELRVLVINLRKVRRMNDEYYILKVLPAKLKLLLREEKRRKEIEEFRKNLLFPKNSNTNQ